MPLLYEPQMRAQQTLHTNQVYLLKTKLFRPLTSQEIQRLRNIKSQIEQKASIHIQKIETTNKELLIYFTQQKTKAFVIPIIWAVAAIVGAIGLPVTAWFITQPPAPGPLGLPQLFWVGLGLGIPIIGFGIILLRRRG